MGSEVAREKQGIQVWSECSHGGGVDVGCSHNAGNSRARGITRGRRVQDVVRQPRIRELPGPSILGRFVCVDAQQRHKLHRLRLLR